GQALRGQTMRTIRLVMVLLLLSGLGVTAADPSEQLTPERRQEMATKVAALNADGLRYYRAGNYVKAIEVLREALELRGVRYPQAQSPAGPPALATSLNNLGNLHLSAGEYGQAGPLLREALDMDRALYPQAQYPDGHPQLAIGLNSLGVLHSSAGESGKA